MRTTSFPDASVQAPRVGRIQAMQASDATGQKCRRASLDCSQSDFQDRSSPESGSPSERADGSDPVSVADDPQRWELCGALTIVLVLAWALAAWMVTP